MTEEVVMVVRYRRFHPWGGWPVFWILWWIDAGLFASMFLPLTPGQWAFFLVTGTLVLTYLFVVLYLLRRHVRKLEQEHA